MTPLEDDYTARADGYASHVAAYKDPTSFELTRSLLSNMEEGAPAIDICCGQGDASQPLREAGMDLSYFDATEKMVRKGVERGNIPEGSYRLGNLMDGLPYGGNSFMIALLRYALHDIRDKKYALGEISRVLRRGGEFLNIDMVSGSGRIKELYEIYHTKKTLGDERPCWIPTEEEMTELMIGAGFSDIRTGNYVSRLYTVDWFKEGQITEDRLMEINDIFRFYSRFNDVQEFFGIREEEGGLIHVDLPVLFIRGQK